MRRKVDLPGPGFAEDRDDLAVAQREVDMVEDQPAEMVGGAVGLGDADRRAAAATVASVA